MRFTSLVRLVALGAIWGGSFIFMRVLAPVIGPWTTTCMRLLIGGGLLTFVYFPLTGYRPGWRGRTGRYLLIGAVNSALPFALFAFGAVHLPASLEVVLNSTSPLFAAVFAAIWLGEGLGPRKLLGMLLGAAGVALVTGGADATRDSLFGVSVVACVAASACYGLAGVYIRKRARDIPPLALAGCAQLLAGAILLPGLATLPTEGAEALAHPSLIWGCLAGLGVVCSGVAYVLYYWLIANEGPTRALLVTFLMPIFGMLWAALFLGERITAGMLGGCAVILAGTYLVLRTPGSAATQAAAPGAR